MNAGTVACSVALALTGEITCVARTTPPAAASGPKFSDTGSSLVTVFDAATNRPGPACSALFDAASVTKLGASATCTWLSATRFEIVLGADVDAAVGVGSTLGTFSLCVDVGLSLSHTHTQA